MNQAVRFAAVAVVCCSVLGGFSGKAATFGIGDTVTVTETSVSPTMTVSLYNTLLGGPYTVYAGINNLTIQPGSGPAVAAQGFCIDPFHWSASGPLGGYDVVALQNAPKPPGGPMGSAEADQIGTLWGAHFSSGMSAMDAAALQVAIWEIVGHVGLTPIDGLTITGDSTLMTQANNWVAAVRANSTAGAGATLLGLRNLNGGQDYVIASVPDGGTTVLLLGLGLAGLAVARKQFRFC